jgi:hypothetical protein
METKVEWTMCRVRATWSTCLDGILRSRPGPRHGDSRSKKSINRYNFIKFDNSGAGSGFEKSISWWCRTLDSFVVFRRFGLIWIARASVESFPSAPPSPPPPSLSLRAPLDCFFSFLSKKRKTREMERGRYIREKRRERGTKTSESRNKKKTECDNKTTSMTKGVLTAFQRNSEQIPWKQK